ncbi:MAG: hypothetical protein JXQ75_00695 [Phycisphaerae bacterium]|nr:hypothetical protein [Phycisphaerae bacterium]
MDAQAARQSGTDRETDGERQRPPRGHVGEALHGGLLHFLGPAGLSFACHGLVVLLLAFATWAVGVTGDLIDTEYRAMVVSEPKDGGPSGGFRFPGRAHIDRPDSARASHESDTIEDLASLLSREQAFKLSPVDSGGSGLDELTLGELSRSDVIGTGTGGGVGSGGLGSGLGDRDLAGGGPVGSLWGVGEGQQARSIVYVMDRSGSMGDTFDLLQRELLRAIGSLEDSQLFNVIWFNEGPAEELSKRMLSATLQSKREAFAAIKRIVPSGQTEPIDAIRKGLAYRPDVLFLLSDGDFGEDNEHIRQTIRQKNKGENKRAKTIINTILFVYDTMGDGERVLRAIADENNGTFKHVTEQDLRQ